MKKIITIVMAAILSIAAVNTQAQAFEKGSKLITIGIGGASMFHIPVGDYANANSTGFFYGGSSFSPLTGELSIQGEFSVHKYVGVGFHVGIGGRAYGAGVATYSVYGGYTGGGWSYPSEFNVPLGVIANFHFYQLIADKSSRGSKLHADKIDVYAGVNVGTGIAIHPADDNYGNKSTFLSVLAWGGPQVGARYYFKPNMGVNLEFGYGKTFVNAGLTFNLGAGKGSGGKKKGKG